MSTGHSPLVEETIQELAARHRAGVATQYDAGVLNGILWASRDERFSGGPDGEVLPPPQGETRIVP